ncbi:MAG TPA: hypothetical protein VJB97_01045 [Candidatus Paceibacterota bacterium]
MAKYIIGGVCIVLAAGIGYYFWSIMGELPDPGTERSPGVSQIATSTYATTTFSIVYPREYIADDTYAYTGVPNKPIAGVKFTVPQSLTSATNLSSDTYVSVESLPRAKSCTGDIYLPVDVRAETKTENGVSYSVASSSSAGAGNFYEEFVYALSGTSPCIAVRYHIHSMNIGNFATSTEVREFDRNALLSAFDEIRRSLQLRSNLTP